jgi:hypothetical protein
MAIVSHQPRVSRIQHVRRLIVAVAVIATVLSGSTALAQESSDTTDVEISVLPATATPVTEPPTPEPATPIPGTPALNTPEAPPTQAGIGTVSARFVLVQENDPTRRSDDAIVTLVVRDDRGTAAGWTISLAVDSGTPSAAGIELLENIDGTIHRVLPNDGRASDQIQGITGGRTVGVIDPPISLLHAQLGSGSGVYLQPLVMILPAQLDNQIVGLLYIQVTSAP